MRIALCYDRVTKFGGAERVLQSLHELFPDAPLYTLTYDPKHASWARSWKIIPSFLHKIPIIGKRHELLPPLAYIAWELFDFRDFDVVISITSAEAKAIIVPPSCVHICYCLTPTRYLWSGYFEYIRAYQGLLQTITHYFFLFFAPFLRVSDYFSSQRPHVMIGISEEVRRRIRKYYRRDSLLIYPPVSLHTQEIVADNTNDPYFLIVSRLVPYKRVDIAIAAFSQLGWKLIVVGTGSEFPHLKTIASDAIEFRKFVDDSDLRELYSGAVAVIFPSYEDFGIVPVEAQSFGKPVVAYRKGGAVETVVEGVTGTFFEEQTAVSLKDHFAKNIHCTIDELPSKFNEIVAYYSQFSYKMCQANAEKFSDARFKKEIMSVIDSRSVRV